MKNDLLEKFPQPFLKEFMVQRCTYKGTKFHVGIAGHLLDEELGRQVSGDIDRKDDSC